MVLYEVKSWTKCLSRRFVFSFRRFVVSLPCFVSSSLLQFRLVSNLVPRVLSLPPSRKYPGFGWSRGTQNLGANKNVLHGRGSKV